MSILKKLQENLLTSLWRLVSAHPGAVITAGLILAIISASLSFVFLRLNSNQDRLVSPDVPFQKRYLEHLKNFGDQEYLYVVIKTGGTEAGKQKAIQFAEALNRRLARHQDLIQAVYYRISAKDLGSGALLFASPQEAETLSKTILFLAPFIDTWARDGSLSGFLDMLARLLGEPSFHGDGGKISDMDPAVMGQALYALKDFFKNMDEVLLEKASYQSIFDLSKTGNRYFFTSSGRLLVMRLLPDKDFGSMDVIGKPLQVVRRAIEATQTEFPDIEAGLTGRPALQADEMETRTKQLMQKVKTLISAALQ